MAHIDLDEYTYISDPFRIREQLHLWLHVPGVLREQGFLPLLLSATLAEVAGSMVYVMLLERAYQLGEKAASVGGVLLVQSVLQAVRGSHTRISGVTCRAICGGQGGCCD